MGLDPQVLTDAQMEYLMTQAGVGASGTIMPKEGQDVNELYAKQQFSSGAPAELFDTTPGALGSVKAARRTETGEIVRGVGGGVIGSEEPRSILPGSDGKGLPAISGPDIFTPEGFEEVANPESPSNVAKRDAAKQPYVRSVAQASEARARIDTPIAMAAAQAAGRERAAYNITVSPQFAELRKAGLNIDVAKTPGSNVTTTVGPDLEVRDRVKQIQGVRQAVRSAAIAAEATPRTDIKFYYPPEQIAYRGSYEEKVGFPQVIKKEYPPDRRGFQGYGLAAGPVASQMMQSSTIQKPRTEYIEDLVDTARSTGPSAAQPAGPEIQGNIRKVAGGQFDRVMQNPGQYGRGF